MVSAQGSQPVWESVERKNFWYGFQAQPPGQQRVVVGGVGGRRAGFRLSWGG